MMISQKMNDRLNQQVTNEFFASQLYLQMSCVLKGMTLPMLSEWFDHHAIEERSHGMKIVRFVYDVGGTVNLQAIPAPQNTFDSVIDIVQSALDHELQVTGDINALVALAEEEKDYASRSFLQWFVDEQVEEVSIVQDVLDLVKLAEGKHMLQVEGRIAKLLESPAT
jgi:ferritin